MNDSIFIVGSGINAYGINGNGELDRTLSNDPYSGGIAGHINPHAKGDRVVGVLYGRHVTGHIIPNTDCVAWDAGQGIPKGIVPTIVPTIVTQDRKAA